MSELNLRDAGNLDIDTMLFARTFAENPAARIVRHDATEEPLPLRQLVDQINERRTANRQVQLILESMPRR